MPRVTIPGIGDVQFSDKLSRDEIMRQAKAMQADALKPQEPMYSPKDLPTSELFKGAWSRGMEGLKGTTFDLMPALGASLVGQDEYAKHQMEEYNQRMADIEAENPTAYQSFKNIQSPGEAFQYAAENLGEMGPDMVAFMMGSGFGSVGGKYLARKGLEKGLRGEAEAFAASQNLSKEEAKNYANNLVKHAKNGAAYTQASEQGARVGLETGLWGSSMGLNIPDTFNQVYQDTGKIDPIVALTIGPLVGALDTWLPEHMLKQLGVAGKKVLATELLNKSDVVPTTWKSEIGKAVLKTASGEGLTEGAQQTLQNLASHMSDPSHPFLTSDNVDSVLDASLRGFLGGGIMGMPGSILEGKQIKDERNRQIAIRQAMAANQVAAQKELAGTQGELFPTAQQERPPFDLSGGMPQAPAAPEGAAPVQQELPFEQPQQMEIPFAEGLTAQQAALTKQLDALTKQQDAQAKAQAATTENIRKGKLDATPVQTGAVEALKAAEPTPAAEPAAPDTTHILDTESLKGTGLAPTKAKGSFFQQLVDKDLSNPEDVSLVGDTLSKLLKNKNISPEVKDAVKSRIIRGVESGRKLSESVGEADRAGLGVPSEPTQAKGTEVVAAPQEPGVVPTGEPVVQPTGRTEAKPTTLEKPSDEKTAPTPAPEVVRPPVEAQPTAEPTQPAPVEATQPLAKEPKKTPTKIKGRANVVEEYNPGLSSEDFVKTAARVDDVNALPKVDAGQEEAGDIYDFGNGNYALGLGNGNLIGKVGSGAPVEKTLGAFTEELGAPKNIFRTAPNAYVEGTEEFQTSARPGEVPFDVSQGYQAFAADDISNMDDQLKVRYDLLQGKPATPEEKAAHTYFGKMKRIVDNLLNIGFDLAFDTPQFSHVGGEANVEASFFNGMNGKQARLASKWVYDNLSAETGRMLRDFTRSFEIARDTVNDEQFMDLVRDGIEGVKESRTDSTVQDYIDAMKEEAKGPIGGPAHPVRIRMHKILTSVVNRMAQVLHPRVVQELQRGDLVSALRFLAASENTFISKLAARYADVIGATKVEVRNDLRDESGKQVPGYFDPATNTVYIDSVTGINSHVLLHEVGHALMSHELDNPNSQLSRQLSQLFDAVKDSLDSAYGATNVHEFAAEAKANPEFRETLKNIHPNGGKFSAWDKFKRAVANFIRKILGMPPKPLESALDEADRIIDALISPAPESRNGGLLYGPNSKKGEKILKGVDDFIRKLPILSPEQKATLSEAIKRVINFVKKGLLAFMPGHALGDLADSIFPGYGKKMNQLLNLREGLVAALNEGTDVIADKAKAVIKTHPDQLDAFDGVVYDSTLYQVDPTKDDRLYTKYSLVYETYNSDGTVKQQFVRYFNTKEGRDSAMGVLNKTVPDDRSRARILKDVNQETLDKYNELRGRYKRLHPDMQKLYVDMRDGYKGIYEQYKNSILDRIGALEVDEAGKVMLRRDIMSRLVERETIDPYFALGREGDYWLSYNLKAEHTLDGLPDRAHEAYTTDYARDERIKELQALGYDIGDLDVYSKVKESNYRSAPPNTFVNQVLKVLENNNVGADTIDDIMSLFVHMLPETSAAKAFMKRTRAPGFNKDSIGTFVRKARNMTHQIANMQYNYKLDENIKDMEAYAEQLSRGGAKAFGPDGSLIDVPKQDSQTAVAYIDEYKKRLDYMKNPHRNNLGNLLTAAPFIYTLGFNVSSGIVNVANIPMIVMPYLKGRYKGANVNRAISDATKAFFGSGRTYEATALGAAESTKLSGLYSMGNYEKGTAEYEELGPLIEEMKRNGQLRRSQAYEMLNADPKTSTLARVNHASGWVMHQSERMNREITAIAAYRLEVEKLTKQGKSLEDAKKQAAREAVYLTELTNGGISAAAAPRIAQSTLGKMFFMYKRYGVSMYYMMFKTAKEGLANSDLTPEEQKAARRQLGGIVGMSALMAGAQGIPLFGLASLVWSMFADDDDDDLDTVTRKYLGEFMYKGPLEYATNLSIASRFSLNDLIIRDTKGGSPASTFSEQLAQTVGGPAYGVGQRIGRGYSKMAEGHFERGLEDMLPAAIANTLKAGRYATEGTSTLRGDPVTGDVSAWNVGAQFFGIAPADYTRQIETNAREKGIDRMVNEKSTQLRKRWNAARTFGDRDGMEEARDELLQLGAKHRGLGITPSTINQTLEKSKKQYDRATKEMVHGVQYSKKMRKEILNDIAELED